MKYGICKHCLKQQTPPFVSICDGCDELLNMAAVLNVNEKRWSSPIQPKEVEA